LKVKALHRQSVAGILKDTSLEIGDIRYLTKLEISMLYKGLGL